MVAIVLDVWQHSHEEKKEKLIFSKGEDSKILEEKEDCQMKNLENHLLRLEKKIDELNLR